MFVWEKMSVDPISIDSKATVDAAASLMKRKKIRRLPVVDNGKVVGIVSELDIMKVAPSPATTLAKYEINSLLAQMQIKDIMIKDVVSISKDAAIEEAALIMYKEKIGGIPVVDDDKSLCGIITETDIFKTLVDMMGLYDGTTRVTIAVKNRVGIIKEVSTVFAEMGLNIDSLVCFKLDGGDYEIVIRGVVPSIEALEAKLKERGYPAKHVVKIGG